MPVQPMMITRCPHCGVRNETPTAGVVRCGQCQERFEVDVAGGQATPVAPPAPAAPTPPPPPAASVPPPAAQTPPSAQVPPPAAPMPPPAAPMPPPAAPVSSEPAGLTVQRCPSCNTRNEVPAGGGVVRCGACSHRFEVSAAAVSPASARVVPAPEEPPTAVVPPPAPPPTTAPKSTEPRLWSRGPEPAPDANAGPASLRKPDPAAAAPTPAAASTPPAAYADDPFAAARQAGAQSPQAPRSPGSTAGAAPNPLAAFVPLDFVLIGVAVLLAVDLTALPWFSVSVSFGDVHTSYHISATNHLASIWAYLATIIGLLIPVDVIAGRLVPQLAEPALARIRSFGRVGLAGLTALCVLLKFVLHIHFKYFGYGFYLGIVAAIALVGAAVASMLVQQSSTR